MSHFVYILYSAKLDRYYVGSCQDIDTRINQHNLGRNKSTKAGVPWIVKYTESYNDRASAMQREREIKAKKSRKYLEVLISSAG